MRRRSRLNVPAIPRVNLPALRTPELSSAASAAPGLMRVATGVTVNAARWGMGAYVKGGLALARAVADPEEGAALLRGATELASDAATVVGVLARSLASGQPVGRSLMVAGESLGAIVESVSEPDEEVEPPQTLRERGAALLQRSRDVWDTGEGHPAYGRILDEMAPDEARVLLLLLHDGPQPSVDVRSGGPMGMVSSQLIAQGLSMIGARSGVRYADHVPAYLNNLFRLGLVWFSKEPLKDPDEYQVLEAQPAVLAALHSVRFARVVRRSVHLTPFGEGFCRSVLVDESKASEAFPEHEAPDETEAGHPPTV